MIADDGIATGATASVAAKALRALGARRLILTVPVSSPESLERLASEFDEVVCLEAPAILIAIGQWYENFEQVSDELVVVLLEEASGWVASPPAQVGAEVEIEDGVAFPERSRCLTARADS